MSYGLTVGSVASELSESIRPSPRTSTPATGVAYHDRITRWLAARAGDPSNLAPWMSRYGLALVSLAVATAVRMLLDPILDNRAPYGCYLLAVLFVVWRAGLGPALVTVACGTMLARYLFESPRGSLVFDSEANQSSLAMSLTIGIVSTFLFESLRITARENRRLYQEARQADARKDEFLATLAHELRNPLVPIRNAIYLLEAVESQPPRAIELRHMIYRQSEHLVRLVNDLLDVSRITQGKIELQYDHAELEAVVAGAVDVVRPLIEEKHQELHISLPPGKVNLRVDAVRLTQILTNLLHNASKYTAASGRIWLTVVVEQRELVIRIRDTGVGFAPAMRERIFELFEQAHPALQHSSGGLGIGLTLVRSLVQLHGGTVEANSPGPELGSEFVVRLPVVAQVALTTEGTTSPRPLAKETSGGRLRVLVVDDSPAVAISLQDTIAQWQHVVETCSDGFAALEAVRSFKPDVVLADLGMPRMSGYQLAQELQRLPEMQNVSLIALSGYGQEADRQRSREAGFVRHLVKPVKPDELQQTLAEHGSRRADA